MLDGSVLVTCFYGFHVFQEEDLKEDFSALGNYHNLTAWHNAAGNLPANIPFYIWDQINPPDGYSVADYGVWEPLRIGLLRDVPSKNKAGIYLKHIGARKGLISVANCLLTAGVEQPKFEFQVHY